MVRGNGLSVNLERRWGRKSPGNGRIWCWRVSRIRCAIDDAPMREASISLSSFPGRFVSCSRPLLPSRPVPRSLPPSSGVRPPPPSNVTSTMRLRYLPVVRLLVDSSSTAFMGASWGYTGTVGLVPAILAPRSPAIEFRVLSPPVARSVLDSSSQLF